MTSAIGFVPLYYMPPVSVFRHMSNFPKLDFRTHESYAKMSFRNRCIIAGSQGMQTLSIPIKGGRGVRDPYQDVIIDHRQPWHLHHWRAIYSAYGRSPWFEYFATDLEKLYASPPERLVEWNLSCIDWLFGKLGISVPVIEILGKQGEQSQAGYRNQSEYDLSPQHFQQLSIDSSATYIQVFQDKNGFFPNLSMLDFILCAGPRVVRDWILKT